MSNYYPNGYGASQPHQPEPYGQPYEPQPQGANAYESQPYGSAPQSSAPQGSSPWDTMHTGAQFPPGPENPNPNPALNEPHYGISFMGATKRYFTKAFRFNGFASRSEYWWAYLFIMLLDTSLYAIWAVIAFGVTAATSNSGMGESAGATVGLLSMLVLYLVLLALNFPILALTIRRLHDAGYSGWFMLLWFVPFGSVVVLILCILDTNQSKWQPNWVDSKQ